MFSSSVNDQPTTDYTGALEALLASSNVTASDTQDYTAVFNDLVGTADTFEGMVRVALL